MNLFQLTCWILACAFAGLAAGRLVNRMAWAQRRREAYDRVLWAEAAERASAQHDLRRIAKALEHIADQFPVDQAPYFERMLVTLQEWTHVRR